MTSLPVSVFATTALLILASVLFRRFLQRSQPPPAPSTAPISPETIRLVKALAAALPGSVLLPDDTDAFAQSTTAAYWAAQECEVVPGCVVQPRDAQELAQAVSILQQEHENRQAEKAEGEGIFAVRSGGHSPVMGAASIEGGAMIDLSLLHEVTPADDGTSTTIGAGAKWKHVSQVLDKLGLAVVGGRNADVGVGGLTLGGGLSFFSPRFGLVCSNILSYEVVLASGSIVVASALENPDLWRALKGGSNNFGIVTRFIARSFPSANIWSGFLYMPPSQANKVLTGFYEYVNRTHSNDLATSYDEYAAGPIACFTYVQKLGIQVISVNLVHTRPAENEKKWPLNWRTSSFQSIWRFWSTCKVQTLTSACEEMSMLNPPGRRQAFATTTIKNDPATIAGAHDAYRNAIDGLRRIKGLTWTLVLQPLLPHWARKGDVNPLGLDIGSSEPLVLVTMRYAVEMIDKIAAETNSGHQFRYLNYCDEWQRPFEGYGEENWRFLKEVSRKYDPDELFQKGCAGGFKLDIKPDSL